METKLLGESFMEILVFDWWRKNHQSSAHKGIRLFRFCVVSGRDTRDSPMERRMGTKIGMVQNYTEMQSLRQNRRWTSGIQVEHFTRIQYVAVQSRSQHLLLISDETPENFTGRIFFMSMFNDISCQSRNNEKECESDAQFVSLFAKRFWKRQCSFIGTGSEHEWYSISPQG